MELIGILPNVVKRIREKIDGGHIEQEIMMQKVQLRAEIEHAKQDWVYARNYFQNVTDPALVDHAVYLLEAAEVKYMYLLRQARSVKLLGS